MIKYLKICSIGMMVLGILLCCGGAWIIQDDVSSREHLRKAIYVLFSISTLKDSIICQGKSNTGCFIMIDRKYLLQIQ